MNLRGMANAKAGVTKLSPRITFNYDDYITKNWTSIA